MSESITVRRGQYKYTLVVEPRGGEIHVTALKRLHNIPDFLFDAHEQYTHVRISKEYVFLYTSTIGHWIKPLSDEAPVVIDMRHVHAASIRVDLEDTLCYMSHDAETEEYQIRILTVHTREAEPVRFTNVMSYFLHEIWGPVMLFRDKILQVSGTRIPIQDISSYDAQFHFLNNRLFLFANNSFNHQTSRIIEVFPNRVVVLKEDFNGRFTDIHQAVDWHNGTAYIVYRTPQAYIGTRMLDLSTFAVTHAFSCWPVTAVSDDRCWMLNNAFGVFSATEEFGINRNVANPGNMYSRRMSVQGNWMLFSLRYSNGTFVCIRLVHWPTRQVVETFEEASAAVFVDGRILINTHGELSWYDGHSHSHPLVAFLYGELKGHKWPVDLIGEFSGESNRGEYRI